MNPENITIHFEEVQAFSAWGYVALATSASLPFLIPAFVPGPRLALGLGLAPVMLLLANLLCLRTRVDDQALTAAFGYLFPLYHRRIPRSEIARAEAVTYSPLGEYGGWGIRGMGENTALNARGSRGVRLILRNGNRVLVGSQRAEELAAALHTSVV